jgi:hypothetical protein
MIAKKKKKAAKKDPPREPARSKDGAKAPAKPARSSKKARAKAKAEARPAKTAKPEKKTAKPDNKATKPDKKPAKPDKTAKSAKKAKAERKVAAPVRRSEPKKAKAAKPPRRAPAKTPAGPLEVARAPAAPAVPAKQAEAKAQDRSAAGLIRKEKEEAVTQKEAAAPEKKRVLRVARGEQRPSRTMRREDPVEKARAALAKIGDEKKNGEVKHHPGPVVEINPRLESSRDKIESKPDLPAKPLSVAEKKRAEAEAQFAKIAPQHEQLTQHFHKSRFDVHISERDSLATQVRVSKSDHEALSAALELVERYKLPPDQAVLTRIVGLGDARLTKVALEELLELDDKGRVRATTDLIDTLTRVKANDAEIIELKDLLLEKVGARS